MRNLIIIIFGKANKAWFEDIEKKLAENKAANKAVIDNFQKMELEQLHFECELSETLKSLDIPVGH